MGQHVAVDQSTDVVVFRDEDARLCNGLRKQGCVAGIGGSFGGANDSPPTRSTRAEGSRHWRYSNKRRHAHIHLVGHVGHVHDQVVAGLVAGDAVLVDHQEGVAVQ